jgi:hypothetical protein
VKHKPRIAIILKDWFSLRKIEVELSEKSKEPVGGCLMAIYKNGKVKVANSNNEFIAGVFCGFKT